jgi:prepilin-type N-terminal cleavage/methylation domain-containing protein
MNPIRGRTGFSLIEVLLSMTILLLSMVAIGQLIGVGSDDSLRARFTMNGTRLAESKLAEVEAGAVGLDGSQTGQFEGDDSDWSWTVESAPSNAPNLYEVTVTAKRDFRGVPFEISFARLVFDPKATGSAAQAERPPDSTTMDPLGTVTMP